MTDLTTEVVTDTGRFVMVPEWVLFHADLTGSHVRLYGVYASYADAQSNECWPSLTTIAERLGAHRNSVREWRNKLASVGALTVERRYSKKGGESFEIAPLITIKRVAPAVDKPLHSAVPPLHPHVGGGTKTLTGGVQPTVPEQDPLTIPMNQRPKLSTGEGWRSNQAGVTADDVLDRMASNGVVPDFGEDPEPSEGVSSLTEIRERLS